MCSSPFFVRGSGKFYFPGVFLQFLLPPVRLSLTLTMFQNADSPIRLSAITAGGSQAVFFKVNTLGEEAFLDDVKDLLKEILEE